MNWETMTIAQADETVYYGVHPTGLPIYVLPKKGFSSTYAVIGTRYGSIDNDFAVDGEQLHVPAGIAHYLEHKLFEDKVCQNGRFCECIYRLYADGISVFLHRKGGRIVGNFAEICAKSVFYRENGGKRAGYYRTGNSYGGR